MSDATNARKNWIVTDQGDLVNLDFVSKIMYGGDFVVPQTTAVFIYHGITAGKGATIKYVYSSAQEAEDSYDRLISTIMQLGICTDLREPLPDILSLDVATGSHLGGTIVVITGDSMLPTANIKFDGVAATVITSSSTSFEVTTPAHAAGPAVNVVYDDGVHTSTIAAGYTYT